MKILLLSDLHIEFAEGRERLFFDMIDPAPADVCVLAGDICARSQLPIVLGMFCGRFRDVIFVTGNHEHYNSSFAEVRETLAGIDLSNLHVLDGSAAIVQGKVFLGGTLWFPHRGASRELREQMNDFWLIKNFDPAVYDECARVGNFLREAAGRDDIIVTHHLPSERCVDAKYAGSPLNQFFVCPMDDLIEQVQPKLWCFGHTHESVDMKIGETRMLCNPFGYVSSSVNENFKRNLVVEL